MQGRVFQALPLTSPTTQRGSQSQEPGRLAHALTCETARAELQSSATSRRRLDRPFGLLATLQKEVAGAAEGSVAYTLAAIKDWTFLLGPGWVVGWGNGLILGYLMYRSGLVPRRATWLGLVGGPLIIVSGTAVMFTGNQPSSTLHSLQAIMTAPEFLWELF